MAELFRLRIASEHVVIPSRLMSRLGLSDGDELEFLIEDDDSLKVETKKGIRRVSPSSAEVKELERSEKKIVSSDVVDSVFSQIEAAIARDTRRKANSATSV